MSTEHHQEHQEDEETPDPIIHVLADDRELDSGVIEALQHMPGVQVQAQRLALGDYEVDVDCVFERKTMLDFAESLKDGRLFTQAHRLVNSGGLVALILEGRGSDLSGSQMRREALQGAIVSLTLVFGLPVLRSFGPEETARLILYAASQLRRHASDVRLQHGSRPRTKRRLQLKIVQSLPGIGPARAQQLLEHFGSVEAVMTASAKRLQALPGIGEKTAARIRWALEA
jgi:ERCC4-type nuclease